jgi:NADPH:quinone reductase
MLADGRVRVIVDRTYPLAEAAEAHRRMETSQHIGKIVLVV